MDPEMQQGYEDAKEDFGSMLSCPKCRAVKYLETTKGSNAAYTRGWRLFCMNHHCWKHECEEQVA